MSFFVEARVVGKGLHFKEVPDRVVFSLEQGAGADDFLGHDGAGALQVDKIDWVSKKF